MSIQKKMWSGFAVVIMLVIAFWVVGSLYALLGALTASPPDMVAAAVQIFFLVVGCVVLGWYVTSRWYKAKVR